MKRSVVKAVAIVLCMIMVLTTFSFVFFMPAAFGATENTNIPYRTEKQKEELLVQRLNLLLDYMQYLDENYKDRIDIDKLVDGAFKGTAEALGDRFSEFYQEQTNFDNFISTVDGSFGGIGVQLESNADKDVIIGNLLDGPAKEAGMKENDIFVTVAGTNVQGKTPSEVGSLLRGEVGTAVTVTVKRGMSLMTFNLKRGSISTQSVAYALLEDYKGLAYIQIKSFDSDTASEFANALKSVKAKGATKVILDLRDNGGGYTEQAILAVDQIIEGGYILHYKQQGKITSSIKAEDGVKSDLKFVTLVNGNTASAAELMAAALQDHGYKLVGTNTYGKDYAQQIIPLGEGKYAKTSIEYFLSPNKTDYQETGITPDVIVRNALIDDETFQQRKSDYLDFAILDGKTKCKREDLHINVYGAQQRLKMLGYDVTLSSKMDVKTVQAVKDFQKSVKLYAYGTLDLTTQAKLEEASIEYVTGAADEDYQLLKALSLLGYN